MAMPKRSKRTGRFIKAGSGGGRKRTRRSTGSGLHKHGKHGYHAKSMRHSRKRK
jgi:hypothetical protein